MLETGTFLMAPSLIYVLLILSIFFLLIYRSLNRKFKRFNKMWMGFKIFLTLVSAVLVYLFLYFVLAIVGCGCGFGSCLPGLFGKVVNLITILLGFGCVVI